MGKHSIEKHEKTKNLKNIVFLLIILTLLIYFLLLNSDNNKENYNNLNIVQEPESLPAINDSSSDSSLSNFDIKTFEGAEHLSISNVRLSYENNITYIMFDLTNSSSNEQDIFDFSFNLLDENNILLTSYNVNSEESIKPNTTKTYLLLSTMDLSAFVGNYSISLIDK